LPHASVHLRFSAAAVRELYWFQKVSNVNRTRLYANVIPVTYAPCSME